MSGLCLGASFSMENKIGIKGKEVLVAQSEDDSGSESMDSDSCYGEFLEEDFLLSNFDNDEGLLIEQIEEEFRNQENQESD